MRTMRTLVAAFGLALALAGPAWAEPLIVPPQQLTFDALGSQVTLPITADVDIVAEGADRVASGTVIGNLGDLQAKALPIAQALPLPSDECANPNGVNVVVDGIWGATITAEGDTARLAATGTMTGYACLVGLGAPIASTQFALAVPLKVVVTAGPPRSVGLSLAGPVELAAAGLPADVLALLSEQANAAVETALAEARAEGPLTIAGLPDLVLDIYDAAFFADGETLMVRFAGTSRMSGETFAAVVTELGATPPAGF